MGAASSVEGGKSLEEAKAEFLAKLAQVKESNPDNLCAKHLTEEYFNSVSEEDQKVLYRCCVTGVENPDSGLGCYAMKPADYATFKPFFDKVIREYHGDETGSKEHVTDWDISTVGEEGVLDVSKLGLDEVSMRVRVGRNLTKFNLPGLMDKAERIEFEKTMLEAFEKLKGMEEYGGNIYSLSPDHGEGVENPNKISDEKYKELVDAHIMFKDMDADPYLKSAGISSDWPYGRGCYVSEDGQFIIWWGEEDQLRIMCMKKGTRLDEVFSRLKKGLDVLESIEGIEFAKGDYGYVTSCPSNLGTGMRASVHIKIPNLTKDGSDAKAKEVCKPLGLSVRGTGGEHTPIGEDGTVDISPRARLFIKEAEIVAALYEGIKLLLEKEKAAGEGGDYAEAPKAEGDEAAPKAEE
ncbi:Creatine kinase B-type [Hondaea fermentalgiana]|uniref:Creatine kinase B-type n=1 Tax=Hondaea fermentalgiana TaxID=2315210 RepID=A0A2R5G2R0_9STRA|nr:Creatine kinase B-type [Hondaea fermentalgiana]|eukprot:GBG24609.1 Creatine kinase B-type [Hondaea fermentalgiana]